VQWDTPIGQHGRMPKPPESTKASLEQRLCVHARQRWPNIELAVRHRAGFAYADAHLLNGEVLPLLRLRQIRRSGLVHFTGTPAEALDFAGGVLLIAADI